LTPFTPFTVLGAAGYVGSALVARLRAGGVPVRGLGRGDRVPACDLGHVAYCAGLTTDAAQRPLDALDAHVSDLVALLRRDGFRSLTYLSSTRVYAGADSGREDAVLRARPQDLFAVSKLAGEAACMSVARPDVRVVRLATVYGGSFASPNFLCTLLRDMRTHATLAVPADPETARDYVHVDDVVEALARIPAAARSRIVNLASGQAVRNDRLVDALSPRLHCRVALQRTQPAVAVPPVATDRLRDELGLAPRPLLPRLDDVVAELERAAA
jgi:nucleoside-diphosphate-sugar epimerase